MSFPRALLDKEFLVCNWSERDSVDKDVVEAIISDADWKSNEGEKFLFTSPAVRYDFPYIGKINSWICITNQRIFFWKGLLQTIDNMAVPMIHEIDATSLTRFRLGFAKLFGLPIPFIKALIVKGRFFNGNDPADETNDGKRRERIVVIKGVGTNKYNNHYFQDAVNQLGLVLDAPNLNTD